MASEESENQTGVPADWLEVAGWDSAPSGEAGDPVAALAIDSSNCLVRSDGPMVVTLGVDDLVVVATGGAVLIVPRDQTERVQEAIDALQARRKEQATDD
jgi:mannose-1-phosphate guanylyltransferase/mannose-1-phosphate guanylyltransferase/mannose-6-phosphate isomerase